MQFKYLKYVQINFTGKTCDTFLLLSLINPSELLRSRINWEWICVQWYFLDEGSGPSVHKGTQKISEQRGKTYMRLMGVLIFSQ